MSRRRRRRASDIADVRPRRGLGAAVLLAVGLALVILYKVGVGEGTADFIGQVTGDPALQLPPSVLDRLEVGVEPWPIDVGVVDAGPADLAAPTTPTDAGPDAARD